MWSCQARLWNRIFPESNKHCQAGQSISAVEAVEAGLSWMKKELIPIYGLNSEYIFGFKDAVIQWQKGRSVGRHAHSGHLRMCLGSKTTISRSSFERNVINLVFVSEPWSTPGISFHQGNSKHLHQMSPRNWSFPFPGLFALPYPHFRCSKTVQKNK